MDKCPTCKIEMATVDYSKVGATYHCTNCGTVRTVYLGSERVVVPKTHAALVAALEGLVEATVKDSEEKGISGFTGARLADARAALKLAKGE